MLAYLSVLLQSANNYSIDCLAAFLLIDHISKLYKLREALIDEGNFMYEFPDYNEKSLVWNESVLLLHLAYLYVSDVKYQKNFLLPIMLLALMFTCVYSIFSSLAMLFFFLLYTAIIHYFHVWGLLCLNNKILYGKNNCKESRLTNLDKKLDWRLYVNKRNVNKIAAVIILIALLLTGLWPF